MRRTLILAIIALVLVGIAAFFAFIFAPDRAAEPGEGVGGGSGFFGSLFPFGGDGSEGSAGEDEDDDLPLVADTRPAPVFREVSPDPTSGGYLYPGEEVTMIRYVDRATGHVFETNTQNLTTVRISNTTIPGIQEVLFGDQNNFIIRYLDENDAPENFYIQLVDDVEDQSVQGDFMRAWERGAVSPDGKNVLAVDENSTGSTIYVSDIDGSAETAIFSSPLRSWIPLRSNAGSYLYTAPSSGVEGFLYRVSGGSVTKMLGDVPGLIPLVSPSGRYVLYSGDEINTELALYDTETGEVYSALFNTLANKCVFLSESPVQVVCGVPFEFPRGSYPNDWLFGKSAFNDDIWLIEPINGVGTLLAVPPDDVGRNIDVWQPMVDETGSYLAFINKNDLSFWTLQLKEAETERGESEEGDEQ